MYCVEEAGQDIVKELLRHCVEQAGKDIVRYYVEQASQDIVYGNGIVHRSQGSLFGTMRPGFCVEKSHYILYWVTEEKLRFPCLPLLTYWSFSNSYFSDAVSQVTS